ncbi:MAG: orotate phosphoribosyltransferase [Clostridiales bacterium]|nr:orotate phosphoribosyltransferase [Clostridiales bacterium]
MDQQQIIGILRETGVMQEGHFLLTSGRHSDRYMQCARLFEHPGHSAALCAALASLFADSSIDIVAGPALGGIILAYEVARQLGARNLFAERVDGVMTLRRGFAIPEESRVLVVEDVVTTGGSVREVLALVRAAGAQAVGVGAIVDRSGGAVDFGVPFRAAVSMDIASWDAADCPLCRQGIPVVKPGSRKSAAPGA